MLNGLFKLKNRIRYGLTARYRFGHHVHSPYLYRFMNLVLFEDKSYYAFDDMHIYWRKILSASCRKKLIDRHLMRVYIMLKERYHNIRCYELIYRICAFVKAKSMVTIGDVVIPDTLYMSKLSSTSMVYGIEAEGDACGIEDLLWAGERHENIALYELKDKDTVLSVNKKIAGGIDVLVISLKCMHYDAFCQLYGEFSMRLGQSSIVVFKDIHDSFDTERMWQYVRNSRNVTTSMDIYDIGLAWINDYLPKRNYIVRW